MNISVFNYAMLSKQTWRLSSNPTNLVSHIYKARYFPNCDYFILLLDTILVTFGGVFGVLNLLCGAEIDEA